MTVYQIIKKYQTTCRVVADKRSGIKCSSLNEEQKNELQKWIEMYYDFKDCQWLLNKNLSAYNWLYNKWILFLEFIQYNRKMYAEEFILLKIKYSIEQYVFISEVGFTVSIKSNLDRSLVGTPAIQTVKNLWFRNMEKWKTYCKCYKTSLFTMYFL